MVRIVRYFLESAKQFLAGGEPGGTVLAVANRFGFDAVEVVHVGCGGDKAKDSQHGAANDD